MSICLPFFLAGAFFLGATCSARAKRSSAISGADSDCVFSSVSC